MPEFLLHTRVPRMLNIKRNRVFWCVEFHLTEAQREAFPLMEAAKLCDDQILGLFADPVPGDTITFNGYEWQVVRRVLAGARRGSKDPNYAGRVITRLMRPAPELGHYTIE